MSNVLFIDNFDSFTYNLVDEFEKRGEKVAVYRNNVPMETIETVVEQTNPLLILISPGPASPKDAGISLDVIRRYSGKIPLFGVCLGHQAIIEAMAGVIGRAPEIVHGKSSYVRHDGKTIFKGLENPMQVGRYHSLCGTEIPDCLEVSAEYNGIVMAVRHRTHYTEGVQFHPESILTPVGGRIIENLLNRLRQL